MPLSLCLFSRQPTLNAFISHPRSVWVSFRNFLQKILRVGSSLEAKTLLRSKLFYAQREVKMHMPLNVGSVEWCLIGYQSETDKNLEVDRDYTDFFASENHMINAATILMGSRDKVALPNWYVCVEKLVRRKGWWTSAGVKGSIFARFTYIGPMFRWLTTGALRQ